MHFTTEPRSRYTGNVQFEASKVYTKTAIMAEQLILSMWPTISHILSPKQNSIQFMRIDHIDTREKAAHRGREPLYTWWPRTILSKLYSASCVAMCYISLTLTLALTRFPHITEWYEDIRRTSLLGTHAHNFLPGPSIGACA